MATAVDAKWMTWTTLDGQPKGHLKICVFAIVLAIVAAPRAADASCECPDETCPSACGSCRLESTQCTYKTACTFGSASCDPGYSKTGQFSDGCFIGFVWANCLRGCVRRISQCATCAPDQFGPTCQPCPGGIFTPCNGHGSCDTGISGTGICACQAGYAGPSCQYSRQSTCSGHGQPTSTGTCTCDAGFTGANCSACAFNHYAYPTCRYCVAAATCSGNGACNAQGLCVCDNGFAGAACAQCASNHYGYPACRFCEDSTTCGGHGLCSSSGVCVCNPGFSGPECKTAQVAAVAALTTGGRIATFGALALAGAFLLRISARARRPHRRPRRPSASVDPRA